MSFTGSFTHKALVALGYAVQAAAFVNEVGIDALNIGLPLPAWARIAIPAAGILATRLARLLPTNKLQPTPGTNEDTGPALGKASGEAGQAAGKLPFRRPQA